MTTEFARPPIARHPSESSQHQKTEPAYEPVHLQHTAADIPLTSSALPSAAGLNGRASLRSQRSSIGVESVFGSAPKGVIGKTKPREVIRVERDYEAGETPQFFSGWIWELEGRVRASPCWIQSKHL